jgi:Pyridoxamine 5''-phosphate oxidase.
MNNYEQKKERFEEFLSKHPVWIIASGSYNDITASSISVINQGVKIYFQTDYEFEKTKHIIKSPNVALCCANYQVKGKARILGPTISDKNADLMNEYQKVHPNSYKLYSCRDTSCLIEIDPVSIKIWDYIDGEPYITNVDLTLQTTECIKYINI